VDRALTFAGQAPRVIAIALAYAAFTLWTLGYPEQALTRITELLTLVHGLSHPFSLARALHYATSLHLMRREWAAAQAQAETALALSTKQGFEQWVGILTLQRGEALAAQGRYEEGLTQMHHGLATKQARGSGIGRPGELARIAEAYGRSGQDEAGLRLLDEALAWMDQHGEDRSAAMVYRIKGELLLRQAIPDVPQAEACFHRALDVARAQQAKSLELHAATSLSRLWQRQGKRAEAHRLLAPIYGWFTEGFDTRDLQEAKALLHDLGSAGVREHVG
jgi:predicted ATPase